MIPNPIRPLSGPLDVFTLKELRGYIRDEIATLQAAEKVILMLIERLHGRRPVRPSLSTLIDDLASPNGEVESPNDEVESVNGKAESVAPPAPPPPPPSPEEEERRQKALENRRMWYTDKFKGRIAELLSVHDHLTARELIRLTGTAGEYVYPILKHDPWFEKVDPTVHRNAEFRLSVVGREEYEKAKSQVA